MEKGGEYRLNETLATCSKELKNEVIKQRRKYIFFLINVIFLNF
jgi:hypothetical protein